MKDSSKPLNEEERPDDGEAALQAILERLEAHREANWWMGEGPGYKQVLMRNIQEVNRLQEEAEAEIGKLVSGVPDADAIRTEAIKAKADIAFEMLLQVRNKLSVAYEEVKQFSVGDISFQKHFDNVDEFKASIKAYKNECGLREDEEVSEQGFLDFVLENKGLDPDQGIDSRNPNLERLSTGLSIWREDRDELNTEALDENQKEEGEKDEEVQADTNFGLPSQAQVVQSEEVNNDTETDQATDVAPEPSDRIDLEQSEKLLVRVEVYVRKEAGKDIDKDKRFIAKTLSEAFASPPDGVEKKQALVELFNEGLLKRFGMRIWDGEDECLLKVHPGRSRRGVFQLSANKEGGGTKNKGIGVRPLFVGQKKSSYISDDKYLREMISVE